MSKPGLQSELTLFDVMNLVVGAIIGADIYVASSFGASYLGPLSLVVWVVAGSISIVIALCFAQCASLLPEVGGPYAYAREAWGALRRVHNRLVPVARRVDSSGGFSRGLHALLNVFFS